MEVISRLFNHRPAIQGELLYFINTFDKKLIKENAIFNETENSSKALIENSIPSCQALVDVDLSILQTKVHDCWELSQRILELDQSSVIESSLEEFRAEEDEFLKAINKQKQEILTNYDEALAKLHKDYEEMEQQLQRENSSTSKTTEQDAKQRQS